MKTLSPSHPSRRSQGVALVIVLSVLVLMSSLLVAFMGTVSTERLSQRAAYSTFEAQQAAESAVNLVISQIRAATTQADDGSVAWASQPGLIRTFGRGTGRVFKLYSSNRMQSSEGDYRPDSIDESGIDPANPQMAQDGFVDLNQAILVPNAKGKVDPHYPIVDPRAALTRTGNPAPGGKGRVQGFWAPQDMRHPAQVEDSSDVDVMELPMRVRWLYHLRDGTVVAPDPSTKRLPGASKENPPVARVAFWTDDESSKLNVNTAGENTYWDTPYVSAYHESGHAPNPNAHPNVDYSSGESAALAASQPSANEFQRFPGHPATTNLSPALRWLYPTPAEGMSDEQFKIALYRLTPRLQDAFGSSMAGQRANFDINIDYRVPKRDRLFANLDEFWFRPDRSPISAPSFFGVFKEQTNTPQVDPTFVSNTFGSPQALEQLRFFLTASSRAPDLNLYGLPRVCIWPIHELDDPTPSKSKRSGFDDLIAFCQTVAQKPYYFTRAQPWSTTWDLENSGTKPTDVLRAFPGRNKRLLLGTNGNGYLRRLADRIAPGTSVSFASKYNAPNPVDVNYTEIDRILLSIFDYIRTTNLIDTGRKEASATGAYKLAYTPGYSPLSPPRYGENDPVVIGSGQVMPSVIYGAGGLPVMKGFGRHVHLSELALLFYRDATVLPGDLPLPPVSGSDERVSFRCVILPEFYNVSPYFPGINESYCYRIKETNPFMVSNPADPAFPPTKLDLANGDLNYVDMNSFQIPYGRFWMPTRGIANQFWTQVTGTRAVKQLKKPNNDATSVDTYKYFPFYSKRLDYVRKAGEPEKEFKLSSGTLEFELYPLSVTEAQTATPPLGSRAAVSTPIQRITMTFPEVVLKAPRPVGSAANPTNFQTRIQTRPPNSGNSPWIDSNNDVIRSMEPNGTARGDQRFVAGLAIVPETIWAPTGLRQPNQYQDKNIMAVHNLRISWGADMPGARFNSKLSPYGSNRPSKPNKIPAHPPAPASITAPPNDVLVAGDFDRGISKHHDGPFINKGDEGNTRFDLGDDPTGGGYLPYFRGNAGYEEVGDRWFSPNRQMSSAVMFGSLPTGMWKHDGRPWETLLFCPPTSTYHTGVAVSPPDHYMLDWFTMPVVEPFAISEPLSTMGKINLNSRLAPFGYVKVRDSRGKQRSYIQRHTGLWGIFKNMRQLAIGQATGFTESGHREGPLNDRNSKTRFEVDPQYMMDEIIDPALDDRKFFRTPSEICELDLPLKNTFKEEPGNATKFKPSYNGALTARKAFWAQHDETGDNGRERPYAHIYPRLTTKSNVFTVHVWAQSLAKATTSKDWDIFDEETDRVLGEYRGSTTVERFIDVNEEVLEKYDAVEQTNAKSLDPYYRFRIVNQKRFIVQ